MASEDERLHAARLLKIHSRNLRRLEEKKARLGGDTDLAMENQIDEERANIAALEPIANPPTQPSQKIQEFVKQTTPGEIDMTMLYLQGVQINTRVSKQEEQNQLIIEEQSRARMSRLDIKQVVDGMVAHFSALLQKVETSERRRQRGAWVYRIAILAIFVWVVLHQFGAI